MPKPPPMLSLGQPWPIASVSCAARSSTLPCASMIASALSAWLPVKMWRPRHSAPPAISSRARSGTRSASTPKGLAPPPIFMPEPLSSKLGLTRMAMRGALPRRWPMASARRPSPSLSQLSVTPAPIAASSSSSRLPGPAKLIRAGSIPTATHSASSPEEAMSNPSTSGAMWPITARCGLALTA